jgi:hypothetical protein
LKNKSLSLIIEESWLLERQCQEKLAVEKMKLYTPLFSASSSFIGTAPHPTSSKKHSIKAHFTRSALAKLKLMPPKKNKAGGKKTRSAKPANLLTDAQSTAFILYFFCEAKTRSLKKYKLKTNELKQELKENKAELAVLEPKQYSYMRSLINKAEEIEAKTNIDKKVLCLF